MHKLAKGKGDTKQIEGRLAGYHRLRSGSYRIIFHQRRDNILDVLNADREADEAVGDADHE